MLLAGMTENVLDPAICAAKRHRSNPEIYFPACDIKQFLEFSEQIGGD